MEFLNFDKAKKALLKCDGVNRKALVDEDREASRNIGLMQHLLFDCTSIDDFANIPYDKFLKLISYSDVYDKDDGEILNNMKLANLSRELKSEKSHFSRTL